MPAPGRSDGLDIPLLNHSHAAAEFYHRQMVEHTWMSKLHISARTARTMSIDRWTPQGKSNTELIHFGTKHGIAGP